MAPSISSDRTAIASAFVSQKDRGQSDAINQGLRRATGDVACWLNSDDVFTPHAIRIAVDAF